MMSKFDLKDYTFRYINPKIISIKNNTTNIIGYWDGKYIDETTYTGIFTPINPIGLPYIGNWTGKWENDKFNGTFKFISYLNDEQKRINDLFTEEIKQKNPLTNSYDLLLWTHNMPLSIFSDILLGEDENKCLKMSKRHNDVQFRYGIDSQYGDVIFVMKPDFFIKKNLKKGECIIKHIFIGDEIDFFDNTIDYINELLLEDAKMFNFREFNIKNDYSGKECRKAKWNNSWCNFQLHFQFDVSFKDVLFIYLPLWITFSQNLNTFIPDIEEDISKSQEKIDNSKYRDILTQLTDNNSELFKNDKIKFLKNKVKFYGFENPLEHYSKIK